MSIKKIIHANKCTKTGFWTGIVAAVCCFTPVLVLLLPAVGLGALIGYIDIVLLPVLGVGIVLFSFGYYQYRREK